MTHRPRAIVLGIESTALTEDEERFLREADPLGFILFARNVEKPEQARALCAALREVVGRPDAPILIDQEGGRVQRLKPPHWRQAPPAETFGRLAARDLPAARRAVYLNHRLLASELVDIGVSVDCAPVADLRHAGAHDVIGDRAFGADPLLVADLCRVACEGFLDGGILPIVKHLPGHGRALQDSHHALPTCETMEADLCQSDFLAFRLLRDQPWAMTAHIVYEAIDASLPATTSPEVVARILRGYIGFDGVIVSDDLSMEALSGSIGSRARAALAAGCDLALHCNGKMDEMAEAVLAVGPMSEETSARVEKAARRPAAPQVLSYEARKAMEAELETLLSVL